MSNSSNEKNNSKAIIIVLAVAIIISLIIVCVSVVYIIKGNSTDAGSGYDYSYSANNDLYHTTGDGLDQYLNSDIATEEFSEQASSYGGDGASDNKATTKNSAVAYYESFSKNGDNKLSDHYDNVYIKLIAAEYGVDTDLLVAIYSVPDTGNNFVLEFNGSKDSNGNIIKSPDTLKKVYQIDLDRNIKVATSSGVGNVDVSYAEGLLCFSMVKTIVMSQYPDYFTGIE